MLGSFWWRLMPLGFAEGSADSPTYRRQRPSENRASASLTASFFNRMVDEDVTSLYCLQPDS